jgi:prophage endopeptidase
MSLLNPYVILGAIVTAISVYFFGHHAGWADRDAEMQSEIALKNEQSRATEQKLNQQINETSTKLQEANNAVTKKQTDINALIRAGRVRLPASGCVQTTASATATTGDSKEAGSESDRATLEAIAAIAAEGDRAINQLNACIDAYNQVREQLNGNR